MAQFYLILLILALVVSLCLAGITWYLYARLKKWTRETGHQKRERSAQELFLQKIGTCINTSLDLETVLQIITEHVVESTEAAAGAIFLIDPTGQNLEARASVGAFPPLQELPQGSNPDERYLAHLLRTTPIPVGKGLVGFAASTGEGIRIADAQTDPRVPTQKMRGLQIRSMMITPLRLQQKMLGVLVVANKAVGSLDKAFSEHEFDLMQTLANQAALTVYVVKLYEQLAERQQIEKELQVAQEFQRMLLPRSYPKVKGLDIAAFSRPALEIGGDYYDFIEVDKDHIGIAIIDVSGKGIPGALVMASVRSTLKAEAIGDYSPKSVLKRINLRMVADTKQNVFITMTYGIIDLRTGRLRFARAGHEPLISWSRKNHETRLHEPAGIALGMVGNDVFDVLEEMEITLERGDGFVLFTDGVVEAMNRQGEEYGMDRFLAGLRMGDEAPCRDQIQQVLEDISRFTGGIPQQDDITMVAVKTRDTIGGNGSPESDQD